MELPDARINESKLLSVVSFAAWMRRVLLDYILAIVFAFPDPIVPKNISELSNNFILPPTYNFSLGVILLIPTLPLALSQVIIFVPPKFQSLYNFNFYESELSTPNEYPPTPLTSHEITGSPPVASVFAVIKARAEALPVAVLWHTIFPYEGSNGLFVVFTFKVVPLYVN